MKKILFLCVSALLILSGCNFFTFDNPADPYAENFAGIVRLSGVEKIVCGSRYYTTSTDILYILADGMIYKLESSMYNPISRVSELPEGIIDIVSSSSHFIALYGDGNIWSWSNTGFNDNGELGRDFTNETLPAIIPGFTEAVTRIAASYGKSAAVTASGKTYIWGDWTEGNTAVQYDIPTELETGFTASEIALEGEIVIISNTGSVYRWNASLDAPEQVAGLSGITALSAGSTNLADSPGHFHALDSSGTVWSWGANIDGQLGDGTNTSRDTPAAIPGLSGVTSIHAGFNCCFAFTADGLYAWGNNESGQLVKAWNDYFYSPVLLSTDALAGGETPILLYTGNENTSTHSTYIYTDGGTLYGYGSISEDMPASGRLNGYITDLSVFSLDNDFIAAGAALGYGVSGGYEGYRFGFLLSDGGRLYGWGDNSNGLMGDGTTDPVSSPEDTGITGISAIACKGNHAIALTTGGTVIAWGEGSVGELGNNATDDSPVPVNVTGLSEVTDVAAGVGFSLAVIDNDTLWGWGSSYYGQIGGSTRSTPEQITGLSGVTDVAAGLGHTLTLMNDGTVWALGLNDYGQLGNGTTDDSSTPVQVTGLTDVTAIAAGSIFSAALKSDGTVWAWGSASYNAFSQGDDASFVEYTEEPFQVPGITDAAAIAAIYGSILILRDDGSLAVTTGSGDLRADSQEGSGPFPLDSLSGLTIEKIYGGSNGYTVIDDEGRAYCW